MNETEIPCPGPVPENETPETDNPVFVSACMAVTSVDAASLGWRLGKSVLTHSDLWGLVWRIDFRAPGHPEDSDYVNRRICWGTKDGEVLGTATVFGQKPL